MRTKTQTFKNYDMGWEFANDLQGSETSIMVCFVELANGSWLIVWEEN